jgi:putative FmdB family regulatory protein
MPLYDYQCKDCGEAFEVRAAIKEKEAGLELVCPKCGSHEARQMLTAALMLHGRKEFSPPTCGPNAGPGCCG